MKDSERFGKESSRRKPGDKTVHVTKRKRRRRLRVIPNIPGIIRFFSNVIHETPFIPLFVILMVVFLLASLGIYLIEQPVNAQFGRYADALWWSFAAMQTQGANFPGPITPVGMLVGAIWSIIGTVALFGVIIATIYAYYVDPKRRPSSLIIDALQYNLEQMENLSADEVNALRDTVVNYCNARIAAIEKSGQPRS